MEIHLTRLATTLEEGMQGYRTTLEATAEGMTKYVFVMQRIHNYSKQNFDDVFVAVATPAQIEDFAEDAPLEGSSYFRTYKIDLLSRTANHLEDVITDILGQLQDLVVNVEKLNELTPTAEYVITAGEINA